MELDVTISIVVLLPVALALVAGGLVLYRRSTQAGWRAAGMGSLVLGVGTLLVFALTLPVSREGEAPEPVIGSVATGVIVPTQSTDTPATQQGRSSPAGDTAPPIPQGTPRASLTYEGAVYYLEALSSAEAANLNEDGLELVGSTTDSNTLPPNSGESLKIYGLKNGEAYQVYTLTPGRSFQNEDGSTITIEPEWIRWVASTTSRS